MNTTTNNTSTAAGNMGDGWPTRIELQKRFLIAAALGDVEPGEAHRIQWIDARTQFVAELEAMASRGVDLRSIRYHPNPALRPAPADQREADDRGPGDFDENTAATMMLGLYGKILAEAADIGRRIEYLHVVKSRGEGVTIMLRLKPENKPVGVVAILPPVEALVSALEKGWNAQNATGTSPGAGAAPGAAQGGKEPPDGTYTG